MACPERRAGCCHFADEPRALPGWRFAVFDAGSKLMARGQVAGAGNRFTQERKGNSMSDQSEQEKFEEEVEALEEARPTQEFKDQVSGEEWHGDAGDQANDLREYEEELEIREQSRRPEDPKE
jgi:hypothetical protein